jgi:diacylglycerol kinase (ATP)
MKNELTIKKTPSNSFSIKARLKSFQYAFEGLSSFFSTQPNAVIHLIMTLLACSGAVFYNISKAEAIAVTLSIGFVWTAELFNTALEKLADIVSNGPSSRNKIYQGCVRSRGFTFSGRRIYYRRYCFSSKTVSMKTILKKVVERIPARFTLSQWLWIASVFSLSLLAIKIIKTG